MKNKVEDLRNYLFEQMDRLSDDEVIQGEGLQREINRAKAMSELAKTLIDSARVEVDYLKVKANTPRSIAAKSTFIESEKALPSPTLEGGERNP